MALINLRRRMASTRAGYGACWEEDFIALAVVFEKPRPPALRWDYGVLRWHYGGVTVALRVTVRVTVTVYLTPKRALVLPNNAARTGESG